MDRCVCGRHLPEAKGVRLYCSNACRERAKRLRRKPTPLMLRLVLLGLLTTNQGEANG